jgi:hypothetical protein
MKKFKRFDTLLETAFAHFSNGGFREGSPIKVKKSFLNSPYCKQHYSGNAQFVEWLNSMIELDRFFFIKRVVGHGAMQDVKNANSNEGAGEVYLILKTDPRTVSSPTELNEFTVPGDYEYIELLNFGNNLPPVQGVPNKYEQPIGTKAEPIKIEINVGNLPKDSTLPLTNTSIPASPAIETRYA